MNLNVNEKEQARGLLVKTQSTYNNLDVEVAGLIIVIRHYLDPFCEDATTLNSNAAMSAMTRLHNSIQELKNLKAKISELEAYLD